jgi:hypothetical protein
MEGEMKDRNVDKERGELDKNQKTDGERAAETENNRAESKVNPDNRFYYLHSLRLKLKKYKI